MAVLSSTVVNGTLTVDGDIFINGSKVATKDDLG